MPRKQSTNDEDADLFRSAIGKVRQLPNERIALRAPPPLPDPVQTRRDNQRVSEELLHPLPGFLDPDAAEPLRYLKPGLNQRILLQLGRGHFSVRDEIDLHQMGAELARRVIHDFIDAALDSDKLCVKIITGKGMHSKGEGPVLKVLADRILRQRKDVLGFRSARHNDGGSGAIIVLLQKRR